MAKNTNVESSAKKHMDLGDHLEYIESLLGGGGAGGNVNDVTVNGSSVVTDKVAAIELKTINNESLSGSGNLEITSEYTVVDFNEDDQGDQAKLAEVYSVCPQLLRIHSNSEGLQMYRLDVDDRDLHNIIHYSCLIGSAIIELSITESSGTYTLGVTVYSLTPINS